MVPFEFGELTADLVAELEGDEEDPWGEGRLEVSLAFRSKPSHVALQEDGGPIVACAGWVLVDDVEVGDRHFPVVGLGGVIVREPDRGRGLAGRVVGLAIERAAELGPEFMLLFCLPDRMGLYAKLGFAEVPGPVRVQQPGGSAEMPLRTMWRGLRGEAGWPPGATFIHSLPF